MEIIEVIKAVAPGGFAAVLLGVVIAIGLPKFIAANERHAATVEKITDAFRADLAAERGTNREDMRRLESVLTRYEDTLRKVEIALQSNTLETTKVTHAIAQFRSSVTTDLPGAIHRALGSTDIPRTGV